MSVQGAAAANQQLLRRATEGACGIGAGCGGEFGQGCLHVLAPRTGKALQMRIQPGAMEQVAAGALGRRLAQKGLVQQRGQQGRQYPARGGPAPVLVEIQAQVLLAPAVHERVARPAVEAQHRAIGPQHAEVGDAAQVERQHGLAAAAEHALVKGRHQRRALAAGGHVAAAQVGHDRDAGQLGQQCWVAQLQRIARAVE